LLIENFALVDAEGTGIIKRDQIEILMRSLGYSPTQEELRSPILFCFIIFVIFIK